MAFAKANNVLPNIIAIHATQTGSSYTAADMNSDISAIKSYLAANDPSITQIDVTEAVSQNDSYLPGVNVQFLAVAERQQLNGLAHSCWNNGSDCAQNGYPADLDGLLATDGSTTHAVWYAYQAYANITGTIVGVNPSQTVDGVAGQDSNLQQAYSIFGRNGGSTANITYNFANVSSASYLNQGGTVHAVAYLLANDNGKRPSGPVQVVDTNVTVASNAVSVTVPNMGSNDVAIIQLTPSGNPGATRPEPANHFTNRCSLNICSKVALFPASRRLYTRLVVQGAEPDHSCNWRCRIHCYAARALRRHGYSVILYDNLSTGHRAFAKGFELVEGDIADAKTLTQAMKRVDAVMHFAAHAYVGESVENPRKYFRNNVESALLLLNTALDCGVRKFVFSSTCAVYGSPEKVPITEDTPRRPVNPYGVSKLFFENALEAYDQALRFTLRHACAISTLPAPMKAAKSANCTIPCFPHLIPLALAASAGTRPPLQVFGSDYPTPDGTCVRDYIHVNDLAEAHVMGF